MDTDIKNNIIDKSNYSFSGADIHEFTDGKCEIITYPMLLQYNNIHEPFNGKKALVLLYETGPNYGHWTCLLKHPNNVIEHFDSYGLIPDDELKFIPKKYRKESGQDHNYLTELLYKSGCDIEYNHTVLQKYNKDAGYDNATCGRWCAVRIYFRRVPLKKFVKIMKSGEKYGVSPDDVVVYLTAQFG